ncbi:ShlB/FhaC/HecB family hemolysin secretion/activation protein [Rhodoferax sp.]|uniref:ShlB/FhaC/HecB family hemolysin secretion/activation protein n=1 Tax=Rhodoferax sp. TaxID=50421 RepID=UPI002636EE6C|nr:ShlB/FhaC/HecB family hemolysin secretion/activation protein [Rhodoferax sp.]MDD2811561.1 ShlB/FhaC/HecB family hemolysin secretion/activation protein [Rhodoferax sp.]
MKKRFSGIGCALALALLNVAAWGQQATSFSIKGYKVQGNTLLSPEVVRLSTQTHTGSESSFETIQLALESLEKAYLNAGYGSVRVEIPEQELDSGVVTLQVVEGVLGEVQVDPNAFFDADNVRHSLPALRLSETVNIHELNRNLMLANESGIKVTQVTFKRSANNRDVDATVKLSADDPVRWLATVDNTGSTPTGLYRTGLIYQNANLFNRDHSLSLQAMTSPDHLSAVRILGLGYRVPLYALGDALDINVSSSNVDSGQVAQAGGGPDLAISGSGTMLGVRYTHNFDATAELQHALSIGLDQRAYGSSVTPLGSAASLVPDLTTRPVTLSYTRSWHTPQRDITTSLTWLKNLPGGSNGSTADFNQPGGRTGADAGFQTLKVNMAYTERFASQWMLRGGLSAQSTSDLLIAAEQFGVGGSDSVRGFGEREIAGDTGLRAGAEVWAPAISFDPWRMIPLGFIEGARVLRNQPALGEIPSQTISSMGLGLRAAYGRHLTLRMDWGYVLKGVTGIHGPAASDQKLHASMAWVF